MASMGKRGKIPKDVQAIFDKYAQSNVKRLHRPQAIEMLQQEFGMTQQEAMVMFETFDKDKNEIMSIWEFQQFYETVGTNAADVVARFHELDKDNSLKLDGDEARAGLESMVTGTGRKLDEKEIEFFLMTACDNTGAIDLGMFSNLLYRLKLYKSEPPKKGQKTHIIGDETD
ncbi:uncharacterized protein LOC134708553 [Mytilus trossulus]|uniref:uncharacterized protein LOC134708553 n=1 Tax=Mytilus trossulus TaxID=6551 RepID=UPI003005BC1A